MPGARTASAGSSSSYARAPGLCVTSTRPHLPGGRSAASRPPRTTRAGRCRGVSRRTGRSGPCARGRTTVDFNKALLPPCAFADHFVCPFPPPGNTLGAEIAAGERNPLR
ncbi:DUF1684 domain-containing protein [Streptomyces sp. NPDC017991]|uniref:DUF1684 domain-containing protein n=1 Tax=Streptomyces sp. NPDC017991 TaxID=3365026 RepID=UPI0037B4BEDD